MTAYEAAYYYFTPFFGKRNVIKYFQLNHVVTKAKDRRLMKYVVELVEARARITMFYNEQRNVLTCVYLFI